MPIGTRANCLSLYNGSLWRGAVARDLRVRQAFESKLELAPGLDQYTAASNAPVMPDAQGRYPIPMPGLTTAF